MEIERLLEQYYGFMHDFGYFFSNILPWVVFGFAMLDIVLLIVEGSLRKKNDAQTKEIHIDPMQPAEIAAAVSAMGYPKNKNSGVNAEGKAFIKGKYGVYTFDSDENGVNISYDDDAGFSRMAEYLMKHKRYRRSCEANVIMHWLHKHLDPTAPVDCRSKYKSVKLRAFIDRVPFALSVLSLVGVIAGYYIFMELHETVVSVRTSTPDAFTVENDTAIDAYLDDVKWDCFLADDGRTMVNAKGKAKYAFDNQTITIQYRLSRDEEKYKVYAVEIGGTPLTDDAIAYLLYEMFENAANKENKSLYESVDMLEEAASGDYSDEEDEPDEEDESDDYYWNGYEEEEPVVTTKRTERTTTRTTTTTTAEPEPEPYVYDSPLTIDSYPDAIIGYWEDPEFSFVYCFNDDGTADYYVQVLRGDVYYEYVDSYNYRVDDGILYIEQYVGTTTCYKITFDGADNIVAEEFDQGMLGYKHEWVRMTDMHEIE